MASLAAIDGQTGGFLKTNLTHILVILEKAERQIYRTTTVGQLVAALVESRDHTDIRHVFGHHEGGTRGFGIACQRLGISKNDWDHANNAAGFYALIPIIAEKLGLPRYDPAAEQARREEVAAFIKSPAWRKMCEPGVTGWGRPSRFIGERSRSLRKVTGPDNPRVATHLYNLGALLKATNRLGEAEPLYRRALRIFAEFRRRTGHEHPHFHTAFNNYAGLLAAIGFGEDETLGTSALSN